MTEGCWPPLAKCLQDDEGATAVEYAIMASAIAAVIVAVVLALGVQVTALFQGAAKALGALIGS